MTLHCTQLESKCEQMEADILLNKSSSRGSLSSTPRRFGSEQSLTDDQEYQHKRVSPIPTMCHVCTHTHTHTYTHKSLVPIPSWS